MKIRKKHQKWPKKWIKNCQKFCPKSLKIWPKMSKMVKKCRKFMQKNSKNLSSKSDHSLLCWSQPSPGIVRLWFVPEKIFQNFWKFFFEKLRLFWPHTGGWIRTVWDEVGRHRSLRGLKNREIFPEIFGASGKKGNKCFKMVQKLKNPLKDSNHLQVCLIETKNNTIAL